MNVNHVEMLTEHKLRVLLASAPHNIKGRGRWLKSMCHCKYVIQKI